MTAFVDNKIVMQALYVLCYYIPSTRKLTSWSFSLITLGVFLGLTLFTFQSKVCDFAGQDLPLPDMLSFKYDFSGMGPWLFGGLMALSAYLLRYISHKKISNGYCSDDWCCRDICSLRKDYGSGLRCGRMPVVQWIHRLRHLQHQQQVISGRVYHGCHQPVPRVCISSSIYQ